MLIVAKEWGVPAWEVTGENPTQSVRLKWYQRFVAYTNAKAKADALKKEHENSKRNNF